MELDGRALDILGSEHQLNTWIGPKLLAVANHCRWIGAGYEDFEKWVLASHLWQTYEGSTSDPVSEQQRNLMRAWEKSAQSKRFELDDALTDLRRRVLKGQWTGRSGSRDLTVLLAFIDFCQEHNCFTRTLSAYELAKWTPGMSRKTVDRGLRNLIDLDAIREVDRTDKKQSERSTRRYQLNLDWTPPLQVPGSQNDSGVGDPMSTPGRLIRSGTPDSFLEHDLWSNKGLGQSAGRVYTVLGDEWMTRKEVASAAGMSVDMARTALDKLFDVGLVMKVGKKPLKFRRAEGVDLGLIAEALGCRGAINQSIQKIVIQQEANYQLREQFKSKF